MLSTRLRPGLFFASLLALLSLGGCPAPVPAAPKHTEAAPQPLCRLYYTHADDGGDGLTVSGLTSAELRGCGFDAILTSGARDLRYRWLTEQLTEDAVRASLAPIVAAADGMPLWLELGSSTQAGTPLPGSPARSFYDPQHSAHRAMALANLQLIAHVAAGYGITHVGFDFEPYGVGDLRYLYPAARARPLGTDLAGAIRKGSPGAQLFGFCPLSFYVQCPGFRPLLRGFYSGGGVFLNEDAYGMQGDIPRLLRWTHQFTHAAAGAGWFASDRAASGAAWYYQCAPELRAAVAYCPVLMVYRDGAPLWRDRPDLQGAAGNVLRSLAP